MYYLLNRGLWKKELLSLSVLKKSWKEVEKDLELGQASVVRRFQRWVVSELSQGVSGLSQGVSDWSRWVTMVSQVSQFDSGLEPAG